SRNGLMGCLLWLAHEANGFSKIPTLLRTVLVGANWRWHLIEAIERRMETAKIGAEPRKPVP
ncbi:MAG: hypothetical protein WB580_23690, partial [Candidatus Binataceae bacterium]